MIEQAKDIPFKGFSDVDIATTLLENMVFEEFEMQTLYCFKVGGLSSFLN